MAKKRKLIDDSMQHIIDRANVKKKKRDEKDKPVATRLEFDDFDRLEVVAKRMGVKKTVVIRLAILKFLKAWDEGDRPEKKEKTVEVWDV